MKVLVYPNATKTPSGGLDLSKHDLQITASLGQLRVVVLLLFINRVLKYLKGFNVSEEAISNARESARKTASDAVTAVSCCLILNHWYDAECIISLYSSGSLCLKSLSLAIECYGFTYSESP